MDTIFLEIIEKILDKNCAGPVVLVPEVLEPRKPAQSIALSLEMMQKKSEYNPITGHRDIVLQREFIFSKVNKNRIENQKTG